MTHDDDEATTDGVPMPDATDPPNEPTPDGDAMPDPTDLPTEPTTDGEPMTEPTDPFPESTTQGEPMPHAPDLPTESASQGEPMTHDDGEDDALPGFPPEDLARAELSGIARALGHDEVRVLTRIAVRLRDGREV
jgi:hypothetical protein